MKIKEICLNCIFFEVLNEDGNFTENPYCLAQDLYTFVKEDDTCNDFVLSEKRADDIKMGC